MYFVRTTVSFNQTNVELKFEKRCLYYVIKEAFNQTNVELKFGNLRERCGAFALLIRLM